MRVRNAATTVSEISRFRIEQRPSVIHVSWMRATTAAVPKDAERNRNAM